MCAVVYRGLFVRVQIGLLVRMYDIVPLDRFGWRVLILVVRSLWCTHGQTPLDRRAARALSDALFPHVNYLLRLQQRFEARHFDHDDPLIFAATWAYEATLRLCPRFTSRAAHGVDVQQPELAMFNEPTTLILGAGASCPYGFPTGLGLIDEICQLGYHATMPYTSNPAAHPAHWREFTNALRNAHAPSIDSFLENRREFGDAGRIGIAHVLLAAERQHNPLGLNQAKAEWFRGPFSTTGWCGASAGERFSRARSCSRLIGSGEWKFFLGTGGCGGPEHPDSGFRSTGVSISADRPGGRIRPARDSNPTDDKPTADRCSRSGTATASSRSRRS